MAPFLYYTSMATREQAAKATKKWGPIVGTELAGGYASNWAYDKHVEHKAARPNRKAYPSGTKHYSMFHWHKSTS